MKTVNVDELLLHSRFNRSHTALWIVSLLLIIFEGYDIGVVGASLPVIMQEFQIDPAIGGLIGSAGLIGMLIGSVVFGMLSDKIGRIKVIIINLLLVSIFVGLAGLTQEHTLFIGFRVIAGIGLGGLLPSVLATVTEFTPAGKKAFAVAFAGAGIPLGTIMVSGIGMNIMPAYGWRPLYFIAIIPIVLIPFVIKLIPDMMPLYIRKNETERIKKVLLKLAPSYKFEDGDQFEITKVNAKPGSYADLFKDKRASNTIFFCILYIIMQFIMFALNVWTPQIMIQTGYSLTGGLVALIALNCGTITGFAFGSFFAERIGYKRTLMIMLIIAIVVVFSLSFRSPAAVLTLLLYLSGTFSIGSSGLQNMFVGQAYPTDLRGTMLGLGLGVARVGAIAGPIILGIMIATGTPIATIFYMLAIIVAVGFVVVLFIRDTVSNQAKKAKIVSE